MVISEEGNSQTAASTESAISGCVKSVVAAILLENNIEDVDESTCLTILEQIMTRFITKTGAMTQSFAEHAMRSQAHFSDAIMALAFSGVDIPRLKTYSREYKYPKVLEGVKLVSEVASVPSAPVVFQSGDQRKLPKYIQDYFPPMPSVYTFEATPVQKQNKVDYKQVREKLANEKKQIERSLTFFHLRLFENFDSPFKLSDPTFSLLPATYGLVEPIWVSASVSRFENRRMEEFPKKSEVLKKQNEGFRRNEEGERRKEDEEVSSVKEAHADLTQPRKYKRQGGGKKERGEKRLKGAGPKQAKASRQKEIDHDDQSNSTFSAGLFSPGQ